MLEEEGLETMKDAYMNNSKTKYAHQIGFDTFRFNGTTTISELSLCLQNIL